MLSTAPFIDIRFDDQVRKNPDSIALVVEDDNRFITYGELNSRANRLTSVMNKSILAPLKDEFECNHMVSIMIDRDIGMLVAILAD